MFIKSVKIKRHIAHTFYNEYICVDKVNVQYRVIQLVRRNHQPHIFWMYGISDGVPQGLCL